MDAPERSRTAEVLTLAPPAPGPAPAPRNGTVLVDARGSGRALRVSWHDEDGLVVLSVWRGGTCAATFRLDAGDVPTLVDTLVRRLSRAPLPALEDRDAG